MTHSELADQSGSAPDWEEQAAAISLRKFQYELPEARIAQYPLAVRDASKLLVYQNGNISHQHFNELPGFLPENTLLVFNNTKVIPARVHFRKETGAVIEVLLLHPEQPTRVINDAMLVTGSCVWECMIGNKKRWKQTDGLSTELTVDGQPVTLRVSYQDYEQNLVRLNWEGNYTFLQIVRAMGEIPLPPYLNRETEASDREAYQTVYADHDGAVAAPTAGLHFTTRVFEALREKGIQKSFLTLHVGAGTFMPIKSDSVLTHKMHSEQVIFSRELIQSLLASNDQIVAVGTTSLRSLESLYWFGVKLYRQETTDFTIEKLYPYPFNEQDLPSPTAALNAIISYMDSNSLPELIGETEIFIFPGYKFKLCKGIITNFHQPGSTLMLLVAAFVGNDWERIYQEALENNYRFLSYGDSSLLWRNE